MRREYLKELIPEIELIHDKELKEKTEAALCDAMEMGGWTEQTIVNSPVTLLRNTDITSIEHLRDVTKACHELFPIGKKYCERHGVEFDYDTVICGALLHDVGKYPEVVPDKNGIPHYHERAKLMRHPLMGAILAAKYEIPDKIIHAIATHSFEGEKSYQTAESQFVRRVDELIFFTSVHGIPPKK